MDKSIVTLTNGLRVGNFSSPHPFNFVDGTVLPRASQEDAVLGKLDVEEIEQPGIKGTTDIDITFKMSTGCAALIFAWTQLAEQGEVDVVLIPLPVKQAMAAQLDKPLHDTPFRVIRVADRETKAIHIDRFCV